MKLSNKQAADPMKELANSVDALYNQLDDLLGDAELLLRRSGGDIDFSREIGEVFSHLKAAEAKLAPMRNMYKPQG